MYFGGWWHAVSTTKTTKSESAAVIVGGKGWQRQRLQKHTKVVGLRPRPEGFFLGLRSMSMPPERSKSVIPEALTP